MSTSRRIVFGLHGKKRAGKDTVATTLAQNFGFRRYQFAAPLKEALGVMFGWPVSNWELEDWKETPEPRAYGLTPRYLAQTLGTDWGRAMVNENIWVDAALRRAQEESSLIVFTDVRFENEARAIRDLGGKVIRIVRPAHEGKEDAHASEQPLPDELVDLVVINEENRPTGMCRAVHGAVNDLMLGKWK